MHSIELKFGMYIMHHRPIYCIDFGEFRINIFFFRSPKVILMHYRPTSCIDFGEFRINNFFTEAQKRILIHYSLWDQLIISMLMSNGSFDLDKI